MTWLKGDDGFNEHPKMDALERACGSWQRYAAARTVWHELATDCAKRETDGAFDLFRAHRVSRMPPKVVDDAIAALVTARLVDVTDDGFAFHNWLDYQPSRTSLDADRAANRRRVTAHRTRTTGVTDGVGNGVCNAITDGVTPVAVTGGVRTPRARVSRPDPSRPVPTPERERSSLRSDLAADGLTTADRPAAARAPRARRDDDPMPTTGTPERAAVDALARCRTLALIVDRPHAIATALVAAAPAVDVPREIAAAEAWLVANPRNVKRNGSAFLARWLARAQDRAPRAVAPNTVAVEDPSDPWLAAERYQRSLATGGAA